MCVVSSLVRTQYISPWLFRRNENEYILCGFKNMSTEPVLCKKHGTVINPATSNSSGVDSDIDWLEKVECNECCGKWESKK